MRGLRILKKTAFLWNLSFEMFVLLRAIHPVRKTKQGNAGKAVLCYLTSKRRTLTQENYQGDKRATKQPHTWD